MFWYFICCTTTYKISEISEILSENFKLFGAKLTEILRTATASATKEGRILHRQSQKDALDIASAAGTLFYGSEIGDFM